jgi:hypothetical protein
MPKKEKKIGIVYYLNDRVKPIVEDGKEHYPVYCRITYDRMNHQFAFSGSYSPFRWFTEDEFEDAFEKGKEQTINDDVKIIEETIQKVLRIEANHYGKNFSLKGFSNNLYHYTEYLRSFLERALLDRLLSQYQRLLNEKYGFTVSAKYFSFWELLDVVSEGDPEKVISKLDPDFQMQIKGYVYLSPFLRECYKDQEITLYDWFDIEFQNAFKAFLMKCVETGKEALNFFEKEPKHSIVVKTFKSIELSRIDIPLIVNTLSNALVR